MWGVEIGHPDGPLGSTSGPKLHAYRGVLANSAFREQIGGLLRKSIRDHEHFLAHFDALETPVMMTITITSWSGRHMRSCFWRRCFLVHLVPFRRRHPWTCSAVHDVPPAVSRVTIRCFSAY